MLSPLTKIDPSFYLFDTSDFWQNFVHDVFQLEQVQSQIQIQKI